MRLQYEISASAEPLKRVLRGVEQEAKAANRRMGREQSAMFGPSRRDAVAARRYEEQLAKSSAKAQESLDRQRSRAILANVRAEERERLRADRSVARAAEQLDRQRSRGLMQQFREQERAQSRTSAAHDRIRLGAARTVVGGIGSGIGTVAKVGGAAAGLFGGFAVASALEQKFALSRQAALLANQAGDPSLKGQLAKEALNVQGFTGQETLGAMSGFVGKTGDVDAARKIIGDLGKLSLVTGADFTQMGEAAGNAFNVLRTTIDDPKQRLEELRGVMQTLAAQGAMGTIEIKDMASVLSKMGASTHMFQGGSGGLLREVGALGQLAAQTGGAADAAEAATALARLPTDIVEHRKRFEALGVHVLAKGSKTKLADPTEILLQTLEKTGGDLTKTGGLFNKESLHVLQGVLPFYTEAEDKNAKLPAAQRQKAGVAGRTALLAEVNRYRGADYGAGELDKQYNSMLSEETTQVTENMKKLNDAIGTKLAPVVTELVPKITEAIPTIGKLAEGTAKVAEYLLDNPIKGVGAVIAASVAKDVASAGLGALLRGVLTGAGGGAGAAGSGIGAAGAAAAGGGLALGAAGLAATIGIALAADQATDLAKESGGWGGVWAGIKQVYGGTESFFGGVNDYMDDQARRQYEQQHGLAPNSLSAFSPPKALPAPAGPIAASPAAAPKVEGSAELKAAAAELREAAKRLKVDVRVDGGRDPRGGPIKPG